MHIDVSKMTSESLLNMYEIQWQDHLQARKQTWQALNIAGIIAVALVGVQLKSNDPWVICISSILLIAVSFFGMQITLRHRNSVEITKFTIMTEIEKKINFVSNDLRIPDPIKWWDIFKVTKSNTSLFLLRMQFVIQILGWFLLVLGILKACHSI
jgi:hypothetical protein